MNKEKDFLAKEPLGKLLMRLALPTVAAQLINMLYNIVDRMYIGHIPKEGALALTACFHIHGKGRQRKSRENSWKLFLDAVDHFGGFDSDFVTLESKYASCIWCK